MRDAPYFILSRLVYCGAQTTKSYEQYHGIAVSRCEAQSHYTVNYRVITLWSTELSLLIK